MLRRTGAAVPLSVDWESQGAVTAPKNQGRRAGMRAVKMSPRLRL